MSRPNNEMVYDLFKKLEDPEEGDRYSVELERFLAKKSCWDGIEYLTTIEIGNFSNIKELLCRLDKEPFGFSYLSHNLESVKKRVESIVLSRKRVLLELVTVTPRDLGLGKKPFMSYEWAFICEAAARKGLIVCPEEVPLQLRLQHKEKPNSQVCIITQPELHTKEPDYGNLWKYEVGNNGCGFYWIQPICQKSRLCNMTECVFVRSFKEI